MTVYQELKLIDRYVGLSGLVDKALPARHPVRVKFSELAEEAKTIEEPVEFEEDDSPVADCRKELADLTDRIEDWQRGIRDWSEVQPCVEAAKDQLGWS